MDGQTFVHFNYDANGNMISDGRKDLDLTWNLLNLVSGAVMHGSDNHTDDSSLTYAWLSDGTKVSAVADDGNGNGVQKRYLGSFVYTSTGGSSAEPLVLPEILEQNDYLPYGTRIQNPAFATETDNRWRYAGKEEQRFGFSSVTGSLNLSRFY